MTRRDVGTKKGLLAACAIVILAFAGTANAGGDAAAGKTKAKVCTACHGADGKGKKNAPPIAGKAEAAFSESLEAYRSGEKKNKLMNKQAKKLSDEDIANLAAYYGTLK